MVVVKQHCVLFFKKELETAVHLFSESCFVREIWNDLTRWFTTVAEGNIEFNTENIILDFKGRNNNPLNAMSCC